MYCSPRVIVSRVTGTDSDPFSRLCSLCVFFRHTPLSRFSAEIVAVSRKSGGIPTSDRQSRRIRRLIYRYVVYNASMTAQGSSQIQLRGSTVLSLPDAPKVGSCRHRRTVTVPPWQVPSGDRTCDTWFTHLRATHWPGRLPEETVEDLSPILRALQEFSCSL